MINQPIKSQGEQELPGVPVWVYCTNPYNSKMYLGYIIDGEDYSSRPIESELSWIQIYQGHHVSEETALKIYIVDGFRTSNSEPAETDISHWWILSFKNSKCYLELTGGQ